MKIKTGGMPVSPPWHWHPANEPKKSFSYLLLWFLFAGSIQLATAQTPSSLQSLSPSLPGNFPMVRPFSATFRFGWSGVEAARASATLKVEAGRALVRVKGGTHGMARGLWRLDATHESVFLLQSLKPQFFSQTEQYSNRRITTQAVFKSDALWRLRERTPDGGPSKWKRVKITPIRDIVSAMFFVRSQPLADGDSIKLIAYPGDSPFLVQIKVLRRESLKIRGVSRNAIRMEMRLQRIEVGKTATLQNHSKFRTGTVWISDDADRFPLRAEVDIFVGAVFAEIEDVTFKSGN